MWNSRLPTWLALPVWLLSSCGNPNVQRHPVPSAEKLRAADCPPAVAVYQRLLELPPRASVVVTNRSAAIRSPEDQARAAQGFASQCQTALVGTTRRAILRCWLDAPDSDSFQSCSQRF